MAKSKTKSKNKATTSKAAKPSYNLPQGIKRVMLQDVRGFQACWKCGHVTEKQLLTVWTQNRINTWSEKGMLVNHGGSNKEGHRVFALTPEGEKMCRKHEDLRFKGSAQAHSKDKIRHNLGINRKYWSLSEEQQRTAKTEGDIRQEAREMRKELDTEIKALKVDINSEKDNERIAELEKQLERLQSRADDIDYAWETREISTPDFSYINSKGEEVYFEIITNQYKESEISAKVNFSNFMGREIELQRV